MNFKLESNFVPKGDQPTAIKELIKGILAQKKYQILLGATGTGKTFTVAHVIEKINKPTIVLSHNKTLAAQLYAEFKKFFPNNAVEYFISNFDYYRPEAYIPTSDTYIDKTTKSNVDLDAMRMSALNSLITRKDTIVVASVAAIYGALSPKEYKETFLYIQVGDTWKRREFFLELVKRNYVHNRIIQLESGYFRGKGDVIEIAPGWTSEYYIRCDFFGEKLEGIDLIDPLTSKVMEKKQKITIFPANAYTTDSSTIKKAIRLIETELESRIKEFKKENKLLEAQRLEERTKHDLESLKEFGMTSGIENYSRHLDGRSQGERPHTILDYLPQDSLMIIDESHMMIPQINAMYNGDYARKKNLVDYGFRLPSALDNRPLKFPEFENSFNFKTIFVSATPGKYEIAKTHGEVVSQIIRPTGLLEPIIEILPITGQVEQIFNLIQKQKAKKERSLILTITKKMAEELTRFLQEKEEKIAYIHSEHKTFERDEILRKLRKGIFDSVIGVNLLREGIDIPEVSLIMILDADKESFFRSTKSLIQIIGRAARNKNGKVIFFADKMTKSMQEAINETKRRRVIQMAYNKKHHITPETIKKPIAAPLSVNTLNENIKEFMNKTSKTLHEKQIIIKDLRKQMFRAAKSMDFEKAAKLRDLILEIELSS